MARKAKIWWGELKDLDCGAVSDFVLGKKEETYAVELGRDGYSQSE